MSFSNRIKAGFIRGFLAARIEAEVMLGAADASILMQQYQDELHQLHAERNAANELHQIEMNNINQRIDTLQSALHSTVKGI